MGLWIDLGTNSRHATYSMHKATSHVTKRGGHCRQELLRFLYFGSDVCRVCHKEQNLRNRVIFCQDVRISCLCGFVGLVRSSSFAVVYELVSLNCLFEWPNSAHSWQNIWCNLFASLSSGLWHCSWFSGHTTKNVFMHLTVSWSVSCCWECYIEGLFHLLHPSREDFYLCPTQHTSPQSVKTP